MKNLENISEYNIPDNFNIKNRFGLSAMMRIKNEEEFIAPCLIASDHIFDEIIIIYNNSTDNTKQIVGKLKDIIKTPILEFEYPFELAFRGPEHIIVPTNSLHHSAYFYNWCMLKINYCYVCKHDGDNILMAEFRKTRDLVYSTQCDIIENIAWDLVNFNMLGQQQKVSYEQRIFNCNLGARYTATPNKKTQYMVMLPDKHPIIYREPYVSFLHCKWCKKEPTYYFPKNWAEIKHYKAIADRHIPIIKYKGNYPRILKDYLDLDKNPYKLIEMYDNNDIDPLESVSRL